MYAMFFIILSNILSIIARSHFTASTLLYNKLPFISYIGDVLYLIDIRLIKWYYKQNGKFISRRVSI